MFGFQFESQGHSLNFTMQGILVILTTQGDFRNLHILNYP